MFKKLRPISALLIFLPLFIAGCGQSQSTPPVSTATTNNKPAVDTASVVAG